ncbi:hypothetical protein ACX35D_002899 [Enterococcus hirae]
MVRSGSDFGSSTFSIGRYIGQVALAATGAIVLSGITISAGHWAYTTIVTYFF